MYATFRLLIINHTECASHTGSFVEIYTGGRLVDFRVSTDGSVSHINRCLCSLRSTREQNEERMAELLKKKKKSHHTTAALRLSCVNTAIGK